MVEPFKNMFTRTVFPQLNQYCIRLKGANHLLASPSAQVFRHGASLPTKQVDYEQLDPCILFEIVNVSTIYSLRMRQVARSVAL